MVIYTIMTSACSSFFHSSNHVCGRIITNHVPGTDIGTVRMVLVPLLGYRFYARAGMVHTVQIKVRSCSRP
jgi:hypothetical protein